MKKEKEINRMFDEEDGIDVNAEGYEPEAEVTLKRITNLLAYREIRAKQAYVSKVTRGDNSRKMRGLLSDIDKDRREKHNLALTSLKGLVEFAKKYNIEPVYTGNILTEQEIEEHKASSYDTRQEMTDAILRILKDLEDCSIIQGYGKGFEKEINRIQHKMYKTKRDYGIKQELLEDNGDVLFDDFDFNR